MKEIQNPKSKIQNPKRLFFVVAIVFVYLFGLGILPLIGPDEPRYSQVAREMFERGDWVTPTLGGFHWFEKPALLYWLQIIGYSIFGVSEYAGRFGSACFGLLTILSVYVLCRFVEKNEKLENVSASPNLSFTASLVAASSIGLLVFSHAASFDIILTFPIAAALICFFISELSASLRPRVTASLFGFYFFIGVALLAKGLIGAVLPFGILFFYFVLTRKIPNKTFLISLVWGGFVSLAVAATWYLPMYLQHGWTFVDEFFIQHHFARYTSNKYQHPEPFWFFWFVLPVMTLPWLPFFLVSLWNSKDWKWREPENAIDFLRLFALAWVLFPILFFSFSGSKLPGYILPALPGAIILTAEQVWRFAQKNVQRELILKALTLAVFASVIIGLTIFGEKAARHDSAKYLIQQADAQGFTTLKVLNLHDIWHSLEFYAAGRLVRTNDGRQQKFEGVGEIATFMQKSDERTILVVVPLEWQQQLTESELFQARKIADNGDAAIIAVAVR